MIYLLINEQFVVDFRVIELSVDILIKEIDKKTLSRLKGLPQVCPLLYIKEQLHRRH